ncbi:MAG TPA: class I SAM-dependent methyltransferase [Thermomicrobiales bacterium]|nr:class I SAM-dependent methyltransferase [Thermomicrobiales bacterium]
MKIAVVPETLLERLIKFAGLAPTPVIETFHAMVLARAIMVATKLGVFQALSNMPCTAEEVARELGADRRATEKLLNVLVAAHYLRFRGGRYALSRLARRWMLPQQPRSLHDNMLLRFLEWDAMTTLEDFVRTGKPLDVHAAIHDDQWDVYQRGMRSLAQISAEEVVRCVPVPADARAMIDLGGGHGHYALSFCRRHWQLQATVLDLPAAVHTSATILANETADRVSFRCGDASIDDLGENTWDLVFMSHLIHHFDGATNTSLLRRVSRALRPGGVLAILDVLRPTSPEETGQTGALLDLYFAITSDAGTWSGSEIARWQIEAGLRPGRYFQLRSAPGVTVMIATKPRSGRSDRPFA